MPYRVSRRELLKAGGSLPLWAQGAPAAGKPGSDVFVSPHETLMNIPLTGVSGPRTPEGYLFLRPGGAPLRMSVEAPGKVAGLTWRLRLIGEVEYDPAWRTPYAFQRLLELADDALDSQTTHHQTYSLQLQSDGEPRTQAAFMRVVWNPSAPARQYPLTIWAKKQGLEILPDGRVGVEAQLYRKRPARRVDDISGPPNATYFLEVGGGTGDWKEYSLPIPMDEQVACVLFKVMGYKFRGKVWFEDPRFTGNDGVSSLPAFTPAKPHQPYRTWIAVNLSRKEWPEFRLTLNGKEFHKGRLFQPEYIWPATEVEVPAGLLRPGKNELVIQLLRNYSEQHNYFLREAQWLTSPGGRLEVVACPELVAAGKEFAVLVSTRERGLRVMVDVVPRATGKRGDIAPVRSEVTLTEAGLQFIRFRAGAAGPGATLEFRFGSEERLITVERVVARPEDNVLVGSGDVQWFAYHKPSLERYFAWHLHNRVGDFVLFRPIYYEGQGTRYSDAEAWRYAVNMCKQAGIYYAYLQNQSELPEVDCAPDPGILESPLYLGSQEHELDGCYYYWALDFRDPFRVTERDFGNTFRLPERGLRNDLFDRNPRHSRLPHPSDPRLATGDSMLRHRWYGTHAAKDMREAAEYFMENVRNVIPGKPRHCGPATLFKYFFQSGIYDYQIGEVMYGPFEVVLASLRGASQAYGQPNYGAHIASQWSTTPHDDPAAFRRYFLALATCYLQGVREIYQEDCLSHMEYGGAADDRFSAACQGHLKVHQEFYRFVRAHSRRGSMRVPAGFLHGQYDGWNCTSQKMVWGQAGSEWDAGAPEQSWDLLKTFFPRSVLGFIFARPCPHKPIGYFTGTPHGPIDVVPIEASAKHLASYEWLALVGWNTADAAQLERLTEYVGNGGHLILGLPHLSTETRRNLPPKPITGPQVRRLLGAEIRGLRAGGADLVLHEAVARSSDGSGAPLLIEHKLGHGRVSFVNSAAYPGEPAVAHLYEDLLRRAAAETVDTQRQRIWVRGSEDVSFTVWDRAQPPSQTGASTIYLLNVAWWEDTPKEAQAHLLWKETEIPLSISWGKIHIVTISGDWGIWTQDAETDVIAIDPEAGRARIRIQGQSKTLLTVLRRPRVDVARPRLRGRSAGSDIGLQELATPGLWRAEVTLDGPAELTIEE